MTWTVLTTIVVEGGLAVGYALWRKKPLLHLLGSLILVNLLTQSLLWLALVSVPQHYLSTLVISETCIVLLEGFLLFVYRKNSLRFSEALGLSLGLNLASFLIGLFLPV